MVISDERDVSIWIHSQERKMKIQKLKVKGFRSLKDITWSPGDLNVIIGPNGSGKSNLLRALELISCSANGKLKEFIKREGGFDSILWDGTAKLVDINLTTFPHKLSFSKSSDFPRAKTLDYLLDYKLQFYDNAPEINYYCQELLSAHLRTKKKEKAKPIELIKESIGGSSVFNEFEGKLVDTIGGDFFETILSTLPSILPEYSQLFKYKKELINWRFYHYLRTEPDAPIRQPVITQYDPTIEPDGSNLISVLHTLYTGNRDFENSVDLAMRSAFGDDFDKLVFPPASDQKIQLRIRWKSLKREVSALDISDGTLRFLFLITILANPEPPSLVAIDEPETGLHPTMLSIIADFAVDASKRTQVIITTHSADFLDAFHSVTPTTTVTECVNGKTTLKILPKKKLKSWLKEYSLGEMFRMRQLEDM